ncbi:MAG: DUF2284 domain-containing protein [Pseudomonadota bacterium]
MNDLDMEKYCKLAMEWGATHVKQIHPSSVVTAPWVRWKCQFGCPMYGLGYCCPPESPTPEQTRAVIDCYHRAILFHREVIKKPGQGRRKLVQGYYDKLVDLEGEMFKDGYYKAYVYIAGHCDRCEECGKIKGTPCKFSFKARPSMEASGIDVYQTARNNGFFIKPLRDKEEPWNFYCLMLVD